MTFDPFEDPTPRQSKHASADSFRGRLIYVQPTKVERDVPKQKSRPDGARGDKVTAIVTVLDGQGPVQVYSQRVPTGVFLDGPVFRGVWFNQDQIAEGLQSPDGKTLRSGVLCRIETLKPGTPAGEGNPWTIEAVSPEEKAAAAVELARIQLGGSAPTVPAQPVNPFNKTADAPF